MLHRFLYNAHSLFLRFCSLFMETNPHIFFQSPLPYVLSVDVAARTNTSFEFADHLFVVKFEYMKAVTLPFHEFLVFYIEDKNSSSCKGIVRVDRWANHVPTSETESGNATQAADPEGRELGSVLDSNLSLSEVSAPSVDYHDSKRKSLSTSSRQIVLSPSASSSGMIASLLPEKPSGDYFTFVDAKASTNYLETVEMHDTCRRVSIKKGVFSVAELVVLANVVHQHHPNYNILEFQCYWYASTIFDMVKNKFKKYVREDILPAANKVFTFKTLPVPTRPLEIPQELIDEYKTQWEMAKKSAKESRTVKVYLLIYTRFSEAL